MPDQTTLEKLIKDIDLRFTSSNPVPVERTAIRAPEWEAIKYALSRTLPEDCIAMPKELTNEMVQEFDESGSCGYTGTWTISVGSAYEAFKRAGERK